MSETEGLFNCVSCSQNGSLELGWFDDNALTLGYIPFDETELMDSVQEAYEKGMERGRPTGWESLDEFYTVRKGDVTVVTGIPNHGKSEFLDAMILNLSKLHDWKFGIYSPENLPFHMHVAKFIEKYIGKPFWPWHREKRMSVIERRMATAWLGERFTFIYPKHRSIEDILQVAELLVRKKQIDGLVIDPWNEIEHSRPAWMQETEYISLTLSKIRTFARMKQIAVWLVVHPRKLGRTDEGKQEVPTPYDLAGSAHFYNKADCILTVWRDVKAEDHMKEMVDIHVQKVRFKTVGKPGLVKLVYEFDSGRYRESQ